MRRIVVSMFLSLIWLFCSIEAYAAFVHEAIPHLEDHYIKEPIF